MLPSGSSTPSPMVNPATTSGLFSHLGGMFRNLGTQGLAYAKQTMHDAVDDMASGMELKDVYERYEGMAEHPGQKLSAKDAIGISVDTAMSGIQMALNMADTVGSLTGLTQDGEVIARAGDAGHRAVDNAFIRVPVALTNLGGFFRGEYRPTTGWVTPAAPVSAAAAPAPAVHNPNPPHLSQQLNAITAMMVQGRNPSQPPVISVIEIMSDV